MNNIILVEDDNDDVYFFEKAHNESEIECEVSVFKDGESFLDFIDSELNAYRSFSSLVFLDLNLPKVSGIDVLKKLQSDGKINSLAIVIYTTSSYQKDIEMAYELGAKSYLVKPTGKSDLKKFLKVTKDYWFNFCELPKVH